jgi:MFS family permease
VAAFEALAVATILPATVREIGGLSYYGWAFTSFMLANLIGIPLSGRSVDRSGPLPLFVAGVLLFTGGLSVSGFAYSMEMLIVGRALQGLGAAALSSVAYVAVARAYTADAQPRIMAFLSSAWVIPGLFGPALAAGIAKAVGWRGVFLSLVPATFVAAGLAFSGLRGLESPTDPEAEAEAAPVWHAILLAFGVAFSLFGIRSQHAVVAAAAGLGGAGLAVYALFRVLPTRTLRSQPGLAAAIAVLALINFAFNAVEAFLPLVLTELRRVGTGLVATALTAGTLAWTGGTWLQDRTVRRLSRRQLLRGGLGCFIAGIGGVSSVLLPAVSPSLAVPAWALSGFGMGIAYQIAILAVLEAAPSGREGQITATMQIANALAVALATGLGADLIARVSKTGQPTAGGIALVDAAALLACMVAVVAGRGVAERNPVEK